MPAPALDSAEWIATDAGLRAGVRVLLATDDADADLVPPRWDPPPGRELEVRIEDRRYRATVGHHGSRTWVSVPGVARGCIDRAAGVSWTWPEGVSGQRLEEWLHGPMLLPLLAAHGRYALHASAIARGTVAGLVLGASGRGKSTLAAAAERYRGFRRAADDLALVSAVSAPVLWPHLRQPKLAPDRQWPPAAPARLEIRGAALLERGRHLTVEPLSTAQALRAVLEHTVAARLFDPELLQRHLGFAAALAAALPWVRLTVAESADPCCAARAAIDAWWGGA